MSFAEAQLAAHDVACFCRVLHCYAVLLEWNLDEVFHEEAALVVEEGAAGNVGCKQQAVLLLEALSSSFPSQQGPCSFVCTANVTAFSRFCWPNHD